MMDLTDDVKCWTVVEVTDLISRTIVPLKACATKSRHVGANFKKFRKVSYPSCTSSLIDREVFGFMFCPHLVNDRFTSE